MSKLELLRDFYEYNQYANDRLLEVMGEAKAEDMGEIIPAMAHVLVAQINWLERWQTGANQVAGFVLSLQLRSLDLLLEGYAKSHADLREYVDGLTDAPLDQPLVFKDSSGDSAEFPLWQLMMHVANHGTYHRGEVAAALTDRGHSPGDIDFIYWQQLR